MSVVSVSASVNHDFSKTVTESIVLVKDLGVEGDCHYGEHVQHRSRQKLRPKPKNLRQVHLISVESLNTRDLSAGDIGENITTEGLDLLQLSAGTRLTFIAEDEQKTDNAAVVLTGLRNPCPQIEKYRPGLQETFIIRDGNSKIVGRLAGVMSIVEVPGVVRKGMKIEVEAPSNFSELAPV